MSKPTGTRRRATPEERSAAYHEAGHAVARYHLSGAGTGRPLWIDGAGPREGRNHHPVCGRPPLLLRLAEALDRIQVCLAGSIAERRAAGRVDRAAQESDQALAAETALRVSFQPETDAMLRWLATRTERLVEFYWSDVDVLARTLLERRSLTSREVEATIRTAQNERRPRGAAHAARSRSGRRLRGRHGDDASPSGSRRVSSTLSA